MFLLDSGAQYPDGTTDVTRTIMVGEATPEMRDLPTEAPQCTLRGDTVAGLYVAGGGISGVIQALRASGQARRIVVVGYELMEVTRAALLDGGVFGANRPCQRNGEQNNCEEPGWEGHAVVL
jgi:LacI family transcriptional regulator